MRNPKLLIRLQRCSKHIRELIWYRRGALCRVMNRWEVHWCSISILKRLMAWVLMARGWWNARSSECGRTESRMAAIKIGREVVDHWWWWEMWGLCRTWSDGGLRRLLAASALVELMGCFING
jgi:hypothetical protein